MKIEDELLHQLSKPSHIVKISDVISGNRLVKDARIMRFAYSLSDIETDFGSIDNMLIALKNKGFGKTDFLFQRTYGPLNKKTYITMSKTTINLNENKNNSQPSFLSGNQGNQGLDINTYIEASRAADYKKRTGELEEEIKDYRSKIRMLEEDNHKLKLKVETVEERADLRIQKEALDKETVFESPGFQKIAEGLGALLPHIPGMLTKPTLGLSAPQEKFTPMLQNAVDLLTDANEEQINLVTYLLGNWNEKLVKVISNYIEKEN